MCRSCSQVKSGKLLRIENDGPEQTSAEFSRG